MARKPKKRAATTTKKKGPRFNGAATRRAAARGPRSAPLPGMGQVRSKKLDNLCEDIGEAREKMNGAKVDEQAAIQAALQVMQKEDRSVFRHAGVELARVPGAEKLRVRLTKEQGDADERDLKSGAEETGGEGGGETEQTDEAEPGAEYLQ